MVLSGRVEEELYFADEPSDEDLTAPARNAKGRQQMVLDEGKSGIGWKFANQGMEHSFNCSMRRRVLMRNE
jgi:hypothetical protein